MKLLACCFVLAAGVAAQKQKLSNEHVAVTEDHLAPGESLTLPGTPCLTIYLTDGKMGSMVVQRGQVAFEPAQAHTIKNTGRTEMKFVRIQFRDPASSDTWGVNGLSPNYKLLLENHYTRVYDIRIPAGTREPQHTHHDRVVVCLSGAQLEHLMPDGRVEPSTLTTGEIAWRHGGTHIGHNLGTTDLWVIAVEPK
jgi:quercetin dioxygenase-like cupin family protein